MNKKIIIIMLSLMLAFTGCTSKDKQNIDSNIESNKSDAGKTEEKNFLGDASNFKTVTLDGSSVSNDIFADYDITMINIWATWCGPCVSEIPELQKVYENLPEGVNMITVCTDGKQSISKAKEIIEEAKAKFPLLFMDANLEKSLVNYILGFPTTVFVDSKGNSIAPEMLGAPRENASEKYLEKINSLLEKIRNSKSK